MHRSEFLKMLKAAFPALAEPINRQKGLLHFEISEFRKFAEDAIRTGDRDRIRQCFALAGQAYANGDDALKNAIDVSFVEELSFGTDEGLRQTAWEMLPTALKSLYTAFHGKPPVSKP